jgi:hypothetical protein
MVDAPDGSDGGGGGVPAVVKLAMGPDFVRPAIVFETIFQ